MSMTTGERALQALRPVRVLHPMLLVLCPVMGLYAQNVDTVSVWTAVRPALVLLGGAAVFWIALWIILRDRYKAGLAASALLVSLVVLWGVLEDFIRWVVPVLGTVPPAAFYWAYGASGTAVLGFLLVRYRAEPRTLKTWGLVTLSALITGAAVAAGLLSPMFGRRAGWLIAGYLMATAALVVAVLRYRDDFQVATRSANWFSGILVGLYVAVIVYHWPPSHTTEAAIPELPAGLSVAAASGDPDIYFIALDGYPRDDVLRNAYAYNNLPFEEELGAKGFVFADRGLANYAQSVAALAACLNFDYIENLVPAGEQAGMAPSRLVSLYHDNRLFRFLKQRGYTILACSPGIETLEPHPPVDVVLKPSFALGEFEAVLLGRTFLSRVMEAVYYFRDGNPGAWSFSFRRDHIQYAFRQLERLPGEKSATARFVFAHVEVPEPPFLFTRDGGLAEPFGPGSLGNDRFFRGTETEFRAAYLDQLSYTNYMLKRAISAIIERSARPAVILVVSSRGARVTFGPGETPPRERFPTLIAARFPGVKETPAAAVYDSMSLVNLFRVTLNAAFNAGLPLLPDRAPAVDVVHLPGMSVAPGA